MRTAVVTGCSSGIGAATCAAFLHNGYKIYGISRTKPAISDPKFLWIKTDLTDVADIQNSIGKISERIVDVLINSAGTAFKLPGVSADKESVHKIFDLNLLAPVYMFSALKDKLSGGLVINISSTSDRVPEIGYALYCSSKAALTMYFDVIALEHTEAKIITILPDYVDTPLLRKEVGDGPFDWTQAITPGQFADAMVAVLNKQPVIKSGSHIVIINTKTTFSKKERLYLYNVDTKKFIDRQ